MNKFVELNKGITVFIDHVVYIKDNSLNGKKAVEIGLTSNQTLHIAEQNKEDIERIIFDAL